MATVQCYTAPGRLLGGLGPAPPGRAGRQIADYLDMDVSALTNQAQATAQNDRTMLVLKKTQDAAKAQAQALIELVKASTPDHIGRNIDRYA